MQWGALTQLMPMDLDVMDAGIGLDTESAVDKTRVDARPSSPNWVFAWICR